MPLTGDIMGDGWRTVEVPGVGLLQVRRPVMRDIVAQGGNPYWWLECARCVDGTRLLPDGVSASELRAEIGNAILTEVMRDRPIPGSSAASGA